jgi:hypothetical protein
MEYSYYNDNIGPLIEEPPLKRQKIAHPFKCKIARLVYLFYVIFINYRYLIGNMQPMESLPAEILSKIISFLDDRSCRFMRLANTDWFHKIQYNKYTLRSTKQEQVSQIFDRLSKYTFPIELRFVDPQCTLTPQHYDELGRVTQLRRLDLDRAQDRTTHYKTHPLNKLTNLEILESYFDAAVTRSFTKLRYLCIVNESDAKQLDLIRFTNLDTMNWNSYQNLRGAPDPLSLVPYPHRLTCLRILYTPERLERLDLFTNLKELVINGGYVKGSLVVDIPHLPNLERLTMVTDGRISPLNSKLTSLYFRCHRNDSSALLPFENLRELFFSSNHDCPDLDPLTNLRTLMLAFPQFHLPPDLKFLTAFLNLENLELSGFPRALAENFDHLVTITPAEKLTLLKAFGRRHRDKPSASLAHITKFGNLQSLELTHIIPSRIEGLTTLASTLTSLTLPDIDEGSLATLQALTALKTLITKPVRRR